MFSQSVFRSFLILLMVLIPMSLAAVSSTNYQIDPADNVYGSHSITSSTYRIDGSIEPIVGTTTSTSYKIDAGASNSGACGDGFLDPSESCDGTSLGGATCSSQGFTGGSISCTSSCALDTSACTTTQQGGGGGGGGGGSTTTTPVVTTPTVTETAPPTPTLDPTFLDSSYFTYESQILLYGTKDATATSIEINGDGSGATYPQSTVWNKKTSLFVGKNTLSISAKNSGGSSKALIATLQRNQKGDITGDGWTNDYDLSRFVKMFGTTNRLGDFNSDGQVDDYDLSQLVAYWNVGS